MPSLFAEFQRFSCEKPQYSNELSLMSRNNRGIYENKLTYGRHYVYFKTSDWCSLEKVGVHTVVFSLLSSSMLVGRVGGDMRMI